MYGRLVAHWVYGGLLAAILLLVLSPLVVRGWPTALAATFFAVPVYMLHQYEEHDDDRFRRFVNQHAGGGHDLLSLQAVFIINLSGVWGVNALSLWLAATYQIGFGLIAAYLMLVNAAVHIAGAVVLGKYNPGLATSVLLFLPLGSYAIVAIDAAGGGTLAMHATGLLSVVAIHALIVMHVVRQRSGIFPS